MPRSNVPKKPKAARNGAGSGRIGYFFARAAANMRQNVFINVVAVGTIALALLIFSLFLLLYVNLEGAAAKWSNRVQVTVYLDQEPDAAELGQLKSRVSAIAGTDSVAFVSKEDAMRRFRSRLKGQEALLAGVTPEVLPAALEITLKRGSRSSEATEAYVANLKRVPGVGEIQYGEEWVKRFNSFITFARLVGGLLGAFLFIAVVFIVSNTIKLTIYSRKEELELLSLVGATRMFIKAPFLIEGVLQGAVGALLALVVLGGCYLGFLHNAPNFISFDPSRAGLVFLPVSHLGGILAGGVVLGFLGSLTSLKRFINV
ncbi:permease-like cell division protein FtsX [Geobacter sp. DSM 9736]|uniref:permease-like cell division protein FtsX n=1 Tax=Geobacter sp. DSM 9736 TaxID=1277350 RepID=UPI000B50651C|nr:permease-like cell division protein FtsX [Geobacter sp. DSM 9736]SNB45286.1 cell division protein FtsX [Geobacter sp. DSM 9736]